MKTLFPTLGEWARARATNEGASVNTVSSRSKPPPVVYIGAKVYRLMELRNLKPHYRVLRK